MECFSQSLRNSRQDERNGLGTNIAEKQNLSHRRKFDFPIGWLNKSTKARKIFEIRSISVSVTIAHIFTFFLPLRGGETMKPDIMQITFNTLQEKDLAIVKEIYDYYILHSTATFHTEQITIDELKEFILIGHPKYKSFLIEYDGATCGYCYFIWYKKRQAYDRTAEVTLYLRPEFHGMGIGKKVLLQLEHEALQVGIKNLLGIITGENEASISLFEKCGYENCARFRQVGEKFGRLLDVVAYQKIIG